MLGKKSCAVVESLENIPLALCALLSVHGTLLELLSREGLKQTYDGLDRIDSKALEDTSSPKRLALVGD
jgi:hypothetical protein